MEIKRNIGMILLIATLFITTASAQNQTTQRYWHNTDYYTVQFDGIGNGFIAEQMSLQSISKTSTNVITINIPYSNVTVYNLISVNESFYSPCYDCPEQASYPYYQNSTRFVNFTTMKKNGSTVLTIYLNGALQNSSSTDLYLFYSVSGLAYKSFQGYTFAFKTNTDSNALIMQVYASVEVPQNMYIKGVPTYNESYNSASAAEGKVAAATPGGSAANVGALLPYFFTAPYQYQASDLLPGEYFTVSGLYGDNLALLYLPEIIFGIIILIIALVVFDIILLPKIKKAFNAKPKQAKAGINFTRPIVMGVVSGFLFEIAYYIVQFLFNLSNSVYYYNSPLPVLFTIVGLIIYGVSLFGLPYYLYYKYGHKEGLLAAAISIAVAIILFLILYFIFYQAVATPVAYPPTEIAVSGSSGVANAG